MVEVGVEVQKGKAASPAPEYSPVDRPDHPRAPGARVLVGGLAEPESAGVEDFEPLCVEEDCVGLVGNLFTGVGTQQTRVTGQAISVCGEVCAL